MKNNHIWYSVVFYAFCSISLAFPTATYAEISNEAREAYEGNPANDTPIQRTNRQVERNYDRLSDRDKEVHNRNIIDHGPIDLVDDAATRQMKSGDDQLNKKNRAINYVNITKLKGDIFLDLDCIDKQLDRNHNNNFN